MIQIREEGIFHPGINVKPGDTFKLTVRNSPIHSVEIGKKMLITRWVCLQIGENGLAYAIGDDNLISELNAAGIYELPKETG